MSPCLQSALLKHTSIQDQSKWMPTQDSTLAPSSSPSSTRIHWHWPAARPRPRRPRHPPQRLNSSYKTNNSIEMHIPFYVFGGSSLSMSLARLACAPPGPDDHVPGACRMAPRVWSQLGLVHYGQVWKNARVANQVDNHMQAVSVPVTDGFALCTAWPLDDVYDESKMLIDASAVTGSSSDVCALRMMMTMMDFVLLSSTTAL